MAAATVDLVTLRKRARKSNLSPEEQLYIDNLGQHYSGNVQKYVKFVKDEMELLRNWPHFFEERESCGEKLHTALLAVASHLLLLGALLAAVSITPFIATLQNTADWKARTYGALWSLVLMFNFATLGSSALFMFHLLGCPPQLGWIWMCNIGPFLISTPFMLMSVSAVLSFVAVSFSAWFLYGRVVGILSTVVATLLVGFGGYLALDIGTRHLKTLNTGIPP